MTNYTTFTSNEEKIEFCASLERALQELHAEGRPGPAATHPEDMNSRVPNPPLNGDLKVDVQTQIAQLEQQLREAGCEGWV
jgi:hypothetical protein